MCREARSEGEALRLRLARAEARVAELQVRRQSFTAALHRCCCSRSSCKASWKPLASGIGLWVEAARDVQGVLAIQGVFSRTCQICCFFVVRPFVALAPCRQPTQRCGPGWASQQSRSPAPQAGSSSSRRLRRPPASQPPSALRFVACPFSWLRYNMSACISVVHMCTAALCASTNPGILRPVQSQVGHQASSAAL